MGTHYVLAVDLGTTNCKTLLIDESLHVIEKVTREYGLSVPQPGWSEQNPEDWWIAVKESIQAVTAKADSQRIHVVGISGQMHGLVLADTNHNILRPAILWNDQRGAAQCDEIYAIAGGKSGLLPYTNNPMLPGYTGGKILWVRDNEPEIHEQIARFLLPKDYLRYRLTGEYATDVSDASGTGLFDVRNRIWAHDLITKLGIPTSWFPTAYESTEFVGSITTAAAAETGLRVGTPVIAGGGDAVMQTVGGGSVNSDVVLLVIGTGGNVTVSTPKPIDNPNASLQVFCHVLPDQWTAMGVTLNAGNSLKWFRDTLGGLEMAIARDLPQSAYELLSAEAASAPPGANGLLFAPYLQGERCPHTDVNARGSFIGLGLYTTKSDIVRAIMEGVTFSLRDVLEQILAAGINPARVHTSGGGAASPVWRQIQADVFNRSVTTLDHSEDASALGAGIVAGVASQIWPSASEAVAKLHPQTHDKPTDTNVRIYNRLFESYRKLYPALRAVFDELAASNTTVLEHDQ